MIAWLLFAAADSQFEEIENDTADVNKTSSFVMLVLSLSRLFACKVVVSKVTDHERIQHLYLMLVGKKYS
jgi:hypothetical protein